MSHNPKEIFCPKCGAPVRLDDHEITEHEGGNFSAEPSIICPHDCGANFFFTNGKVEPLPDVQNG